MFVFENTIYYNIISETFHLTYVFLLQSLMCDFAGRVDCSDREGNENVTSSVTSSISQFARRNLEVDDSEQINRRRKLLRRFHDTPPSGQKVRLRGDKNAFSGYLEMWHPQLNQWGYVCDRDWNYQVRR